MRRLTLLCHAVTRLRYASVGLVSAACWSGGRFGGVVLALTFFSTTFRTPQRFIWFLCTAALIATESVRSV
jgi:hypothetical protein